MKKSLVSVSLLLFLLMGCEGNDIQQVSNNGNEITEITNLQTQIDELNHQLAELQSSTEVQFNQTNQYKELSNELIYTNEKMEHIIKHLPDIEGKLGYIEQINHTNSKTTLRVQLVEMHDDATLPNNYRMEKLNIDTITLSNDALLFVLDNMYPTKIASVDTLNEKIKEYERLFTFSVINDKAELISEMYLP